MRGSTMSLTVQLPASVVPATSPVPHPGAQRPQVQQRSGASAQDPSWSSNRELSPAAASARVRTQARWSFIFSYTQSTHSHCPLRCSFDNSQVYLSTSPFMQLPVYSPIYPLIRVRPLSFTHRPITHLHLLFYKMKIDSLPPQRDHYLTGNSKWQEAWDKDGRVQETSIWSPTQSVKMDNTEQACLHARHMEAAFGQACSHILQE